MSKLSETTGHGTGLDGDNHGVKRPWPATTNTKRICKSAMDNMTIPDSTKLTDVIAQCHKALDEVFLLHQEAALLARFDDAMQILDCFKELHHLHMDFEDKKLIPKLDELDDRGHWPASLYTDEHSKIQELMGKTENDLLALSKNRLSDRDLRRRIISFLDKERTFKGLCEHHQEREESGMLPELDKRTGTKWRASVIRTFVKEWNRCTDYNMDIIVRIDFSYQNGRG